MKAFFQKLGWGGTRIGRQLRRVYGLALLIPVLILGCLLLGSANTLLRSHFLELLQVDNLRVRTLLNQVTSQTLSISTDVCYDNALKQLLSKDYSGSQEFVSGVNGYSKLDTILYNNPELESIRIYSDNPTLLQYKNFYPVNQEIYGKTWYQRAVNQSSAFWTSILTEDAYSNMPNNLCLVRRIHLSDSKYTAVAVFRISDQYIRTRTAAGAVEAVAVDDEGIVYSSKLSWYGTRQLMDVDYADSVFSYQGILEVEGTDHFAAVSTMSLNMTNSRLYIYTLDSSGPGYIRRVILSCVLILLVAVIVPGIILSMFSRAFSGRVLRLREEMHKASTQDYDIAADLHGDDELTQAFEDLKIMVRDIKDKESRMYEAQLKEQELRNKQQRMEFKMLASQINPHYLYNTLETIRMKALTSGNREVADSIKILGKTLHYVLENTGARATTLRKELDHVVNYLHIQKLRFGDRINFQLDIQDGLDPNACPILPLLLQPMVENAVVHGLETIRGMGLIRIEAAVTCDGLLCLSVVDNGNGIPPQELQRLRAMLEKPELPQSGIALYNIHQRIRLCYGEAYGIRMESTEGEGTRVRLVIPMEVPEGKL